MDRTAGKRETDTPGSGDQPAEDTNIPVVAQPGEQPRRRMRKDDRHERKGEL